MIGHTFKKRFGQNFISDINLLDAIVNDAGVNKNCEVLEIGAGAGALTKQLSLHAKKVVSYEIDRDLISYLKALELKNVEFVFEDALKATIESIESHFEEEYLLVANLPYYITTPLIFKFLKEGKNCKSLTIMVQKEVADRIVASPGGKDYGILTVMIEFYGHAKILRKVNKNMFYPQPNVDSALVKIDIINSYKQIDKKKFAGLVKAAFAMRRKTLLNNLSQGLNISKKELSEKLPGIDLSRRAESLSLKEYVDLYNRIFL